MTTLKRALLLAAFPLMLWGGSACSAPRTLCNAAEGESCYGCPAEAGFETCSFEGIEATVESCDGCMARWALFEKLCETGSTATVEEVEEGIVCEEVDTGGLER